jgi:hypothetical protein
MSTDEALDSLSFGFAPAPSAPPQAPQEVGYSTLVAPQSKLISILLSVWVTLNVQQILVVLLSNLKVTTWTFSF